MRIRYNIGPEELWLGEVHLHREEWTEVSEELAGQAVLPARVAEYGFETESGAPSMEDAV
ncbi:MAG: hypothetical protein ACREXY_15360 [Gammaproteobacteria bacterium]